MKLKVISYNIWNKNREETTIAERAPLLNEVVSKYDADLIGIQEYVPAWEEYIEKYFGKDYDIFNKYRAISQNRHLFCGKRINLTFLTQAISGCRIRLKLSHVVGMKDMTFPVYANM